MGDDLFLLDLAGFVSRDFIERGRRGHEATGIQAWIGAELADFGDVMAIFFGGRGIRDA